MAKGQKNIATVKVFAERTANIDIIANEISEVAKAFKQLQASRLKEKSYRLTDSRRNRTYPTADTECSLSCCKS